MGKRDFGDPCDGESKCRKCKMISENEGTNKFCKWIHRRFFFMENRMTPGHLFGYGGTKVEL